MAQHYLILAAYLVQFIRCVVPSEYVEVPFQKYSVVFTTAEQTFSQKQFRMMLHGQVFECYLPNKMNTSSTRPLTYRNMHRVSDNLDMMPCLAAKKNKWIYLICSHSIHKISTFNWSIVHNIGRKWKDALETKSLEGYWEKGEKNFLVRSYTNGNYCSEGNRNFSTKVRFFCRQSSEEHVLDVQVLSPCEHSVHVYTPRVCSGNDFESKTGHSIYCRSPIDAKDLVVKNDKNVSLPDSRQAFGANLLSKKAAGDIFFVANVPSHQNSEDRDKKKQKTNRIRDENRKNKEYRAPEIISSTMGIEFDSNVMPKNRSMFMENYYIVIDDKD